MTNIKKAWIFITRFEWPLPFIKTVLTNFLLQFIKL